MPNGKKKIMVYNQENKLIWEDEIDNRPETWDGITGIGYSYHPKKYPKGTIIIGTGNFARIEIIEEV